MQAEGKGQTSVGPYTAKAKPALPAEKCRYAAQRLFIDLPALGIRKNVGLPAQR